MLFPPEPAGLPCLHGGVAVSLPGLGLEAVCWLAALQGWQGSAVGMLLFWISLQIARPKLGFPDALVEGFTHWHWDPAWSPIWSLEVSSIYLEKRPIVWGLKENARLPTIDLLAKGLKSLVPCDLSCLMVSRKTDCAIG